MLLLRIHLDRPRRGKDGLTELAVYDLLDHDVDEFHPLAFPAAVRYAVALPADPTAPQRVDGPYVEFTEVYPYTPDTPNVHFDEVLDAVEFLRRARRALGRPRAAVEVLRALAGLAGVVVVEIPKTFQHDDMVRFQITQRDAAVAHFEHLLAARSRFVSGDDLDPHELLERARVVRERHRLSGSPSGCSGGGGS